MAHYKQFSLFCDCITAALLSLAALVFCLSGDDTKPFYIGTATWEDCKGGVLPDQVDVPTPKPMPKRLENE